jgi:hypothetical protein
LNHNLRFIVISDGVAEGTADELRVDCVTNVGSEFGSASDVSTVDGFMLELEELGIFALIEMQ